MKSELQDWLPDSHLALVPHRFLARRVLEHIPIA